MMHQRTKQNFDFVKKMLSSCMIHGKFAACNSHGSSGFNNERLSLENKGQWVSSVLCPYTGKVGRKVSDARSKLSPIDYKTQPRVLLS